MCSVCLRRDSNLKLYKDRSRKDGLAKHLFLQCDKCGAKTALETSKRVGGQGGGFYEVNRRFVIA